MPSLQFCFAIAALLLTPGPTNTLLALAAAERGWARAMRLVPLEVLAYGLVTIPLALAGERLFAAHGPLRMTVTLLAAGWVAILAVRLWRLPATGAAMAEGGQGARRLFITTLCNPKGPVIGLVLLPSQQALAAAAVAFFAILLAVSALWAAIGSTMARTGALDGPVIRRVFACWLGTLSVWLTAAALAG